MTSNKNSSSALECCGFCGVCLFVVGLAAASLTWEVFAIIALVKEEDAKFNTLCDCSSHLWAYLLTIVIWVVYFANSLKNSSSKEHEVTWVEVILSNGIVLCIDIGLIVWGYWELFHGDAESTLSHLQTYKISSYWVYANTAFVGIVFLAFIVGCLAMNCCGTCNTCKCSTKSTPTLDLEAGRNNTREQSSQVDISEGNYSPHTSPRQLTDAIPVPTAAAEV